MKVNEFRFLSKDDEYNDRPEWRFWSRPYEYQWIINKLKGDKKKTIHNTSCGMAKEHIIFAEELEKYGSVVNSDILDGEGFNNFMKYDIRDKCVGHSDVVINVSTLEHLNKEDLFIAYDNLYEQADKRLLLTFDYPRVDLGLIEELVWRKCDDIENRLNGKNSIFVDDRYENLNIVVLDIIK